MLILPGVDGRQGVLQAHAVLVQRGFGAGAGGNGEGGVHVLDAGAVVPDHDVHMVPLLLQNDLHPAVDPVGAEIGNRVVDQFAEGLAEVLEVAGDAGEKLLAVGGVVDVSNDDFAHNLFLQKMFFRKQNARCRSLPYIVREDLTTFLLPRTPKKGILSLSVRGIPLCRWSLHLRR